jgi:hypothetical protein
MAPSTNKVQPVGTVLADELLAEAEEIVAEDSNKQDMLREVSGAPTLNHDVDKAVADEDISMSTAGTHSCLVVLPF